MKFEVQLTGAPAVAHEGRWIALVPERRTQLLAFLATSGSWVGRSELAALLWPEHPTKLASTNLRKALFRLSSQPWDAMLEQRDGALRVQRATDLQAFRAELAAGRAGEGLALVQGEFLAGFDDDANEGWTRWLRGERERLRADWRGAALQHARAQPLPAAEALALTARVLEADPLDEGALALQLELLWRSGQAPRARQAWAEFETRLRAELDVEPSTELRGVWRTLQESGLRSRAEVSRTAAPERAPQAAVGDATEGFVGRAMELRQLEELLRQPGCRLVSITGPGGVGKTRLAQRAAAALGGRAFGRAVWVPLEEVSTHDRALDRIAREAGVRLAGGPPLRQLADALGAEPCLIVLDNFEQLAAEASLIESLLQACTGLRFVVTTRTRLATASEWLLPLGGLPFPDPDDADTAEAFDAVRLFAQAARRVEPSFQPAREMSAIADICRLVDGLPLALELVAAWVRLIPCAQIASELTRSNELLRAVDPSRRARHASIAAVFDESWRQLGDAERGVLPRLAVFRRGFTAESARAVADAAAPVLAALLDRSLLHKQGARLVMHPLVQALAEERLGATKHAAEEAHARHYLRWLEDRHAGVRRAEGGVLDAVEADFDNVIAAWRWAAVNSAPELLVAAAQALMDYCDHRNRWLEGLALFRQALASLAAADPPATAVLEPRAAHLLHRLDRYAESDALALKALRALPSARRSRDLSAWLQCLAVLAANAVRTARLDVARRYFRHCTRLARVGGFPLKVAASLTNLSLVAKYQGRIDESLDLALRALMQHRELGDVAGEAIALNNLAVLHIVRDELEPARRVLLEGQRLCEQHRLQATRVMFEINLGDVARRRGDLDEAERYMRVALELSRENNQRVNAIVSQQFLVSILLSRGRIDSARLQLAAVFGSALAIDSPAHLAGNAALLAEVLAAQGSLEAARRVMHFALNHSALEPMAKKRFRESMRSWGGDEDAASPWPGWSLHELARRVVADEASEFARLAQRVAAAGRT